MINIHPSFTSSFDQTATSLTQILGEKNFIIIITNPHDQGESIAAGIACAEILSKYTKKTLLTTHTSAQFKQLHFLSGSSLVKIFSPEIELLSPPYRSAICTIGIRSADQLHPIVSAWRQYGIPLINIDRRTHNTLYGDINMVFPSTGSLSEIIFHHFLDTTIKPDHSIATALLTSLIIATKSFRSSNTTTHSLAIASELISYGAHRETIIHHLYRNRSFGTLKLWGRALSRLKIHPTGLITTTITQNDFADIKAETEEIEGVADELMINTPEAQAALILHEAPDFQTSGKIHGLLSAKQISCLDLLKNFTPQGHEERATFSIPFSSVEAAEAFLAEKLGSQLNFFV
jgi:phosphoesterase RecJ-like protein